MQLFDLFGSFSIFSQREEPKGTQIDQNLLTLGKDNQPKVFSISNTRLFSLVSVSRISFSLYVKKNSDNGNFD